MGPCCKIRIPFSNSVPSAGFAPGKFAHTIYESCRGGFCSRSTSPARPRPPLWEPKPGAYSHRQSPPRPRTAPTIHVSATFHTPPDQSPERPTSARSSRSYESCQYSNCSRSPCTTPRAFDEPVYPYEKRRPLSPPGWPYCSKRVNQRGRWWDKDWKVAERYSNYQSPDLQPCGCHKNKGHAGSRSPSPQRSPRVIGLDYHFSRIGKSAPGRSPTPKRARFGSGGGTADAEGFQGFGHSHQYQNWSCSSSRDGSRPGSPRGSNRSRSRSRTPSPSRGSSPAPSARSQTSGRQRPRTPRPQQSAVVNSHGHCHTYNSWSCTPSNRSTPRSQSPQKSRDPTPPPTARSGGTTTIKVSYNPSPAESAEFSNDLRTSDAQQQQEQQQRQQQTQEQYDLSPDHHQAHTMSSQPEPGRLFLSHCHCHHCHHHQTCPTCGHGHGHHGQTLFTLSPLAPTYSCGCMESQRPQHHHHHSCHCFHHHHHHHHH